MSCSSAAANIGSSLAISSSTSTVGEALALKCARIFAADDGQQPGFGRALVQQRVLRLPGPQHAFLDDVLGQSPVAATTKMRTASRSGRSDWHSAWNRARLCFPPASSFMYESKPGLRYRSRDITAFDGRRRRSNMPTGHGLRRICGGKLDARSHIQDDRNAAAIHFQKPACGACGATSFHAV